MAETLKFGYKKSPYRYVAKFENDAWGEGFLSTDENVVLNESACVLQYAQSVFEGLKARRTKNGRIIVFRADLNAERLEDSAYRLSMPIFPKEKFLEAVKMVVKANEEVIPSYESGGSLYLRPFMIGTTPVLGVKPALEYEFRIFASPVGPYFQGGKNSVDLRVCDLDRAAPHGTGNVKSGLNYAMSLFAITEAHKLGYGKYFTEQPAYPITDDHYYVSVYGGIPCVDIIHYDARTSSGFPSWWHTRRDDMRNIYPATLQAVGEVVLATILD